MSYLIDTLAYNSYYSAFNANMAMNEAFLTSSTVRDNVVNIAKLLNYTPNSVTSSKGCLKVTIQTVQTNGSYPSSITLAKGPVATGGNFIWNVINNITTQVDTTTGLATFDNLLIYEGAIVSFNYIVNTFAKQEYTIPAQDVDIATLSVKVKANESATASDLYSRVDNITGLTATSRAYFPLKVRT